MNEIDAPFWTALCIVGGLAVGSFIAATSIRLPAARPIVLARSACDGCGKPLNALELVPLISFLALRGKCSACGSAIAPRHLILELAGAAIGAWAALVQPGPMALVGAALGWQLLLLAVVDAEHLWLPRALTIPLVASGLLAAFPLGADTLLARCLGAALGFAALWGVSAIYRLLRGGSAWAAAMLTYSQEPERGWAGSACRSCCWPQR